MVIRSQSQKKSASSNHTKEVKKTKVKDQIITKNALENTSQEVTEVTEVHAEEEEMIAEAVIRFTTKIE